MKTVYYDVSSSIHLIIICFAERIYKIIFLIKKKKKEEVLKFNFQEGEHINNFLRARKKEKRTLACVCEHITLIV